MKVVECSDRMSLAPVLCAVTVLVLVVDVVLRGTAMWDVACSEECCVAVEEGWMWMEVINHVKVGYVQCGVGGLEWSGVKWSGRSESMSMNEC